MSECQCCYCKHKREKAASRCSIVGCKGKQGVTIHGLCVTHFLDKYRTEHPNDDRPFKEIVTEALRIEESGEPQWKK